MKLSCETPKRIKRKLMKQGGRKLCVRCPWLLAQTKVATILGTFFHLFLLLLPPLFKTTEGVVIGFQILAWAPK